MYRTIRKNVASEFVFPLLLTVTALGVLIFWPFPL
jgi:hypothetical protein